MFYSISQKDNPTTNGLSEYIIVVLQVAEKGGGEIKRDVYKSG